MVFKVLEAPEVFLKDKVEGFVVILTITEEHCIKNVFADPITLFLPPMLAPFKYNSKVVAVATDTA